MLFNTVDVSLFDLRLNLLGWLLLSAICGVDITGQLVKISELRGARMALTGQLQTMKIAGCQVEHPAF